MDELDRLAHAVLFPSLGRPDVPRWIAGPLAAGLGGFVLFGRESVSVGQLQSLTAELRALAPGIHLAIDEEGGDVSRLQGTGLLSTPGNLALGRIDDLEITRDCARQIGLALRTVGIDWDFAPAVDTAVNPLSPNGIRCFGSDRARVSEHAAAWVDGLQSAGVSACAKHFPGHGLSGTDAHLGTPDLDITRDELIADYLDPFRAVVAAGVDSIMVSHPRVPAVDTLPASISGPVITGLLRQELGYDGVVITDALEMQGVARVADLPTASVLALKAGADALCLGSWSFGDDVRRAAGAIVDAVRGGELAVSRLEEAAGRLRRMGAERAPRDQQPDLTTGPRLARQAAVATGQPRLRGSACLVVRLEPGVSPAAGRGGGDLEGLLQADGRTVERIAISGQTYNGHGMVLAGIGEFREQYGSDGDVIILVRSPHRYEWQRTILDEILSINTDLVVLDMGFVHKDFSAARGWIRTYGASTACAMAATEILTERER
ncbi:glycoside hydrolase family 3 protein [Microlunatus soli]|uniref:Beta-N-acetylhexosaminidase n=1 Tax=Microlunatus soli TaxID=630515 RepID=A0A1H1RX20_9ACTN|nr:glycoside hydrolase family 3 N-terminal domain-containing protein [Microlunatus soli]SDS40240.1 beta-N-acetylhexosaminidase [Microlunatus soli]